MSNKTKEELRAEVEQQQIKRFIKDFQKTEKELATKHGYQMMPVLQQDLHGIIPKIYPFKVKVENETLETQPKADGQSDTDNQAPQG